MRDYQLNFSDNSPGMFNQLGRQRKAITMVAVLKEYINDDLENLSLLNIGGSSGIIDEVLAQSFNQVVSIDIDEKAVAFANQHITSPNLEIKVGDAMNIDADDKSFDVIICSHVYEHVPDASGMMTEIYRVLRPGGVCYFAAGNRIMWNEPHYNLPLLSVLPRPLANKYIKLKGKGDHYYEKHLTYWGLKGLVKEFNICDYTEKIIFQPQKYSAEYLLPPKSFKSITAKAFAKILPFLIPSYIWLLEKPKNHNN